MNDDELRKRFAELRRQDAKHEPSFETITRRRPRARIRVIFAAVPAIAAAAIVLVWCGARTSDHTAPASVAAAAPSPVRSKASTALPLDFLLENAPVSVRLDVDPIEGLRP